MDDNTEKINQYLTGDHTISFEGAFSEDLGDMGKIFSASQGEGITVTVDAGEWFLYKAKIDGAHITHTIVPDKDGIGVFNATLNTDENSVITVLTDQSNIAKVLRYLWRVPLFRWAYSQLSKLAKIFSTLTSPTSPGGSRH